MPKIRNTNSNSQPRHTKGSIVKLYEDYHNNKIEIGKARLIAYISTGLTFILNDNEDMIYNTERWRAEIIESLNPKYPKGLLQNYRIRFTEKVGLPTTTEDDESIVTEIEDSFLTFDGIELY